LNPAASSLVVKGRGEQRRLLLVLALASQLPNLGLDFRQIAIQKSAIVSIESPRHRQFFRSKRSFSDHSLPLLRFCCHGLATVLDQVLRELSGHEVIEIGFCRFFVSGSYDLHAPDEPAPGRGQVGQSAEERHRVGATRRVRGGLADSAHRGSQAWIRTQGRCLWCVITDRKESELVIVARPAVANFILAGTGVTILCVGRSVQVRGSSNP
jgi:hypothetical protein